MIYSTRHLLDLRAKLLSISVEQWLMLAVGLLVGGAVWVFFNRRIVRRTLRRQHHKPIHAHAVAALEGIIGGGVFLFNTGLVYLSTLIASFFLFAFSVAGLLVGAWITIPASFD